MRSCLRSLCLAIGLVAFGIPGIGVPTAFAEEVVEDSDAEVLADGVDDVEGEDSDGGVLEDQTDVLGDDGFDPSLGESMDIAPPRRDDDMVVTANKRAENIQNVPISITALGSDTIREAGITEFSQLQQFVPNLQIRPATDTRSTSVRIRGIGSTGTNSGIDPSVGVFIDGVYQGRAGMSVGDLLDIERVEVLRGPQGTLYGKNTAAGAINILTKKPTYEYETFLEGVIGNYNDMQFRGSTNAPIIDDKLALRISGYKVARDGFATNQFNNQNVNNANQYGFRGKLGWDATDELWFVLIGDYSEQNTDSFVADIINYYPAGPTVTGIAFGNLEATTGVALPPANPFDQVVWSNVDPENVVKVGGVALDSGLAVGEYDLRWLNAWRTYSTDSRFDGDFSGYDAVLAFTDESLNQFSSELSVVSPAWDHFQFQSGFYFFYMSMFTEDSNGWEQDLANTAVAIGGFPFLAFGVPRTNVNSNDYTTLSTAVYGEGTYRFLEKFELTGGLRFTYEEKTRDGVSITTPPIAIDAPPIIGPSFPRNDQLDVTNWQGRAIFRYLPTDESMIYASFANGFKSGGFNQLRVARGVSPEFGDESSFNYELGARTQWFDSQLTANITGYFTDYDNFQAQTFDGAAINVRNAGQLYSYGFESDVVYRPDWVENLILGWQVGFNIAEYQVFPNAENTVPNQVAITAPQLAIVGCQLPAVDCNQNLAGRTLDNAPKFTSTFFYSYEHVVPEYPVWWFMRADWTYTSTQYLAQDLDVNLIQPAYNLLNLRTGLRADDDLWELTLWMNNVSDTDYLVAGFDVPIISGYAGVMAPPRQYGGTVRIRF
jgi:iron complex outermembrane receptor protein